MSAFLNINAVSILVRDRSVLNAVSFRLERGRIGCLLGPSGSGKTTLLHCIAGFHRICDGSIQLDRRTLSSAGTGNSVHIPPEQRHIGMMFQNYALFPHFNVAKNIAFGIRKMQRQAQQRTVDELLELTSLGEHRNKYPHELSGGEQQRVALARALAPSPRLLLLDEPFSSLDSELHLQLAEETRQVITERNITTLLVTHDQEEAFAMSDMLGVINNARLLQWDSAYDVYHKPASRAVATFIGMGSMLRGTMRDNGRVKTSLGDFRVDKNQYAFKRNQEVRVLIRPDDIIHDDNSTMRAVIRKKQFRGPEFLYQLSLENGEKVYCFAPSHHDHRLGEAIGITVDVEHVIIYAP